MEKHNKSSLARNTYKVTHIITGLASGGAENVLFRLIAAQQNPAMHSVISLTDEGIFGERLRALGTEVRCLGLRRNGIPSPMAFFRLSRWLRQFRPDVVQTWMYHADLLGGVAGRLAGLPVLWGVRQSNLSASVNKRSTLQVARLCARLSSIIPTRIVSCSARAITNHRAIGYLEKFDLIPNGLSLARFYPLESAKKKTIRQKLGINEKFKVIGHLGRSDPQKDHATLLAAFAKVAATDPDTCLLLAGMGLQHGNPYLDHLLATSGAYRFSDRILALEQRDDVQELMNAMDVFVLSSCGEAFPNVLVEAMACGTPCVATDVGDSAVIVGDTGWIRQPRDVDGLAQDILVALSETKDQHAIRSLRARQRIEDKFSIEQMVASYDAAWRQALSRDSHL